MSGSRDLFLRPGDPNRVHLRPWIEIEMVDTSGNPQAGERYQVIFPDGTLVEGELDSEGKAFLETADPGTCIVKFPGLNREAPGEGEEVE